MKITGTYIPYFKGEDFGCVVSKIFVHLNQPIDNIDETTFSVVERREVENKDFSKEIKTFSKTITKAYYIDENNNPINKVSSSLCLEFEVSPTSGSPLLFSMSTMLNTYACPYELYISPCKKINSYNEKVTELSINPQYYKRMSDADLFQLGEKDYLNVHYHYAYAKSKKESHTLVVWLHGLGEGGVENTDPYVTCLANRVTALIQDEFQSLIPSHVLVPQCPTFWMDTTGKTPTSECLKQANDHSYYLESLHALINDYKTQHNINKVVICGCSNGGFMTLLMALTYGDEYDVYVPICEALQDEFIHDEQLDKIKDLPLYFIYSKDDTTVNPLLHEIPTIKRLKEMKASQLEVSVFDHVEDLSGRFFDEEGNPYRYNGHWSWIYFDNNEKHVFEWIKDKLK